MNTNWVWHQHYQDSGNMEGVVGNAYTISENEEPDAVAEEAQPWQQKQKISFGFIPHDNKRKSS